MRTKSSNVQDIFYLPQTGEIRVVFRSGSVYLYKASKAVFDKFKASDSKGAFVHSTLSKYTYRKEGESSAKKK